jgi:hypothetical protein
MKVHSSVVAGSRKAHDCGSEIREESEGLDENQSNSDRLCIESDSDTSTGKAKGNSRHRWILIYIVDMAIDSSSSRDQSRSAQVAATVRGERSDDCASNGM